jgi:hypothetical protein
MVRDPRRIFLVSLGAVYAIAFASYGGQIPGLNGAQGILPIAAYLDAVHRAFGVAAVWKVPTVFWISASDFALEAACWLGVAAAGLVMLGIFRRWALAACYVLYLSLATTGQEFMSYQWDMLLLEAGFLAIFFDESPLVVWLFRWLAFRLMFLSGAVKLLSGDLAWRNLTALQYHFWTQPIPNPVAWYVAHLPDAVLTACAAVMFGIELLVPFCFFGPRRVRLTGAGLTVLLQAGILLTGNYTFFNLLAIALCLPVAAESKQGQQSRSAIAVAALVVPLSVAQFSVGLTGTMPPVLDTPVRILAPFGIANPYGLFAVMTTTRPEIIVEGSADGVTWLPYEFRYKPGDVSRRPPQVAPGQPRLDWQMWFAALGDLQQNGWFLNFARCLLRGAPDVLALMGKNPFPHAPPRYLRAKLYDYRFTSMEEHRRTGAWWTRRLLGLYMPSVSLDTLGPTP